MNVLVRGGAGYIGSHTVYELIERGHSVVVVDSLIKGHKAAVHNDAKFYLGDIRDEEFMDRVFKENNIDADLFLGIESGINDLLGRWMITNIAVIEDDRDFESYGTSPSFPVPDNLVQKVLDTNLSEAMDTVLGEDKERHNHSGGIQLLTHNEISRIDLTEYAFIMALTKYINGEKWR